MQALEAEIVIQVDVYQLLILSYLRKSCFSE
jgi:hypothetical protein